MTSSSHLSQFSLVSPGHCCSDIGGVFRVRGPDRVAPSLCVSQVRWERESCEVGANIRSDCGDECPLSSSVQNICKIYLLQTRILHSLGDPAGGGRCLIDISQCWPSKTVKQVNGQLTDWPAPATYCSQVELSFSLYLPHHQSTLTHTENSQTSNTF